MNDTVAMVLQLIDEEIQALTEEFRALEREYYEAGKAMAPLQRKLQFAVYQNLRDRLTTIYQPSLDHMSTHLQRMEMLRERIEKLSAPCPPP